MNDGADEQSESSGRPGLLGNVLRIECSATVTRAENTEG